MPGFLPGRRSSPCPCGGPSRPSGLPFHHAIDEEKGGGTTLTRPNIGNSMLCLFMGKIGLNLAVWHEHYCVMLDNILNDLNDTAPARSQIERRRILSLAHGDREKGHRA
jgi:hypothetical protein